MLLTSCFAIFSIGSIIKVHAFISPPCFLPPGYMQQTPASSIGTGPHLRHFNNLLHASRSTLPSPSDPRAEPRTIHNVTINLPLGVVLEDMDADPSYGVTIISISDGGNAAKYNAEIFSQMKSQGRDARTGSLNCICVRDKIMSVNGIVCHDRSFDHVISLISSTESNAVTLGLGRLQGSTVVNYYHGNCISAKSGESYGFIAGKCGIDIEYECRSGNCGTCMRWMEFPEKEEDVKSDVRKGGVHERSILHCVGQVPRGYRWLHILEP
ncbi:hypothetical protein ACHAWF_006451 [Thalassiosira exigua]